ncbi:MAG: YdcF family protein [Myxococcota bacterium]
MIPLLFALACARPTLQVGPLDRPAVDATLVPGCPAEDDGRLSPCLWRRVVWAHHVWASGLTRTFIVSGNAVYNRYTEAEALKAGLVALGVPADRVFVEPRALHTDENVAYALRIAEAEGFTTLAIASDALQTTGTCDMVREWTGGGMTCLPAPMDYHLVRARLGMGLPDVRIEPVPEAEWMPLAEREQRIAEALGRKVRGNSLWIYFSKSLLAPFGLSKPPVLPE